MSINKVIEILSTVAPEDFDMDMCSTCISGQIYKHLNPNSDSYAAPIRTFAEFVGVDAEIANDATFPIGEENPAWKATPTQAIKMLEILRDEGVVDWDRAMT